MKNLEIWFNATSYLSNPFFSKLHSFHHVLQNVSPYWAMFLFRVNFVSNMIYFFLFVVSITSLARSTTFNTCLPLKRTAIASSTVLKEKKFKHLLSLYHITLPLPSKRENMGNFGKFFLECISCISDNSF